MYSYHTDMDVQISSTNVQRCQSVIANLRIEKLSSLEDGPRFTISLSHALKRGI